MDELIWKVLASVATALGVGVLVATYFSETVREFLPGSRELSRRLKAQGLRPASGTHFTVLVADLDGDADGTQTRHVKAALDAEPGFRTRLAGKVLRIADIGDQVEARIRAERQGREWLRKQNADLLVWGEVAEPNRRLRLRFLPLDEGAVAASSTGATEGRPGSYQLEAAELPIDFNRDLGVALVAQAAASIAPATEQLGRDLVEVLRPAAEKLTRLCTDLPYELGPDERATLWNGLGVATLVLGEQTGELQWLEQSERAFRAALRFRTPARGSLRRAETLNNLGLVVQRRGERELSLPRLEEAVDVLLAALEIRTREHAPFGWAQTQNNLGLALRALGQFNEGTDRLEEAVTAYRSALTVWTRDRVALHWATAQDNLGNALRVLGERREGAVRIALLKEAVEVIREALEVRTRSCAPLDWAKSQTNMGLALRALGEAEESTEQLEEALTRFEAALEVFREANARFEMGLAKGNLGNALRVLGEREEGTARLEEAVTTLQAALEDWPSERVSLIEPLIQMNLGWALTSLGERETGVVQLEEAVNALQAALEVFRRVGISYYIGTTEKILRRTQALLAERRSQASAERRSPLGSYPQQT